MSSINEKIAWTKELFPPQDIDSENKDFIKNIKEEFFDKTLFIHTPKGDVIEMPVDSVAETKIDTIIFNFDLKQGQDLIIPMTYTISDVPNSMLNNKVKMRIISSGSDATIIDNLDTTNNRITVPGVNKFNLLFPAAITINYKIPTGITSFNHGIYLITPIKTLTICEGTINFKKSYLNKADYYIPK
jgi:hypothetical protein